MAATNSDRKKYTRSENCDEKSRNAVYRKVDDTFDRLEKDGMGSNLAKFRIPRKQNQADSKSNTAAVDPRCERKKYNVATETLLKPDAQKHFNSKANDSAAQTAGIHNQDSNLQNAVRRGWNVAAAPVSKRHTLHSISTGSSSLSTGHQSDKLAAAVHSQTAKLCSGYRWNAAVHTSKQQPENNDVGEVTVKQSDPEELTPKLPAELIRAGWKLCWSKQRSRWYVFNIRTGTSSWDVPK